MTTRNTIKLGLSVGTILLFLAVAAALPQDRRTTRSQPAHPASASARVISAGNVSGAPSIRPQVQPTPAAEEGTASDPAAPTQILLRLVAWGAVLAMVSLLAFGAYTLMRARVRSYLGRLRNRQLHRARRRGRRREGEED